METVEFYYYKISFNSLNPLMFSLITLFERSCTTFLSKSFSYPSILQNIGIILNGGKLKVLCAQFSRAPYSILTFTLSIKKAMKKHECEVHFTIGEIAFYYQTGF